jgi:hypothetical protein
MRDWTLLKLRLPELELRPSLRTVAVQLIEGRTTAEIALATGNTFVQVKLKVAAICYYLGRLPPDSPASAAVAVAPDPTPLNPGHALRLPSENACSLSPASLPRDVRCQA